MSGTYYYAYQNGLPPQKQQQTPQQFSSPPQFMTNGVNSSSSNSSRDNSPPKPYVNHPAVVNYGNNTGLTPNIQQQMAQLNINHHLQEIQKPYYQHQQQPLSASYNFNNVPATTVHSSFSQLWGHQCTDLLQKPNILPTGAIPAPTIQLLHHDPNNQTSSNCHPDIFRCTLTKIPENAQLLQKSRLPLGVLIQPFRELNALPVLQTSVIVRCRACRTYINPFVTFVDAKRWKCNLCYRINDLPDDFHYDPVSRSYGVPGRRPECRNSTIEYIAPAEYMLRPPQPAVYLFLMDVSRLAIETGYLSVLCQTLRDEIAHLPGDNRTLIGFITYDSALHYFSFTEEQSRPHEMIMTDLDEPFLPLTADSLLVNRRDRSALLSDFLAELPAKYLHTFDSNSALGAALQMAYKLVAPTGGRITVFQTCLPNIGAGALISREDPSQRASETVAHLQPAHDFYKRLALECSGQQIAVDLFILNSQYVDVATLAGITRFSGGCIYHVPLFKHSNVLKSEQFERQLKRYLTRRIGFETVMRVRCTRGLSIHSFHGNFFVRSTDLLSLPNVNPDSAYGMQVAIEESLSDCQTVCFQAALLYTSSEGDRRIRVHTLCLPVVGTVTDVIHGADQQCIIGLLAKMAVDRSLQSSVTNAREAFINVAVDVLSAYKTHVLGAANASPHVLLAPDCLALLPLYIVALLKSLAFRTGVTTRLDDRVVCMLATMKTRPLKQLIRHIYPDLYAIHPFCAVASVIEGSQPYSPPHLQLSARSLDARGAYLMDTGEHMMILVLAGVDPAFLQYCLGVENYSHLTDDIYELPVLPQANGVNERLHQFIVQLNADRPFPATLHVVRDNSAYRSGFYERLVEDRMENALSYHEFLQHLKLQIK